MALHDDPAYQPAEPRATRYARKQDASSAMLKQTIAQQRGRGPAWFYAVYVAGVVVLLLGAGELAVRLKGLRPWAPEPLRIRVEPGERFFQSDAVAGYRHLPGEFRVRLPGGYAFHVTHGGDTLRITSRPASGGPDSRPEIWILGCSFTHGWSLDDEATYPWLLQEILPRYKVVNFGVNGYSNLQSYLQFKQALDQRAAPVAVVMAYAQFHDMRNILARQARKAFVPWNRLGLLILPYARLAEEQGFSFRMEEVLYSEFPLMRYSALSHYLETIYNSREEEIYRGREVSRAILAKMAGVCAERDILFAIAEIAHPAVMMSFAESRAIPAIDISVDLRIEANSNMPHDAHPSALAHRRYAAALGTFLRENLPR